MDAERALADRTTVLTVLFAAIFWLVVAGVSPTQAAISVAMVVLLGQFGSLSLHFLGFGVTARQVSSLFNARVGPAVGVGLLVMFFLRFVTSRLAFLVVLALGLSLATISLARGLLRIGVKLALRNQFRSLPDSSWQVPASIAIIGLLLRADWWWTAPICISAVIAAGLLYRAPATRPTFVLKLVIGILLVAVGTMLSIGLRTDLWWISYNNDDDPWFHVMAHGLIQWGPWLRPDVASNQGASAAAYHLLAYFFAGLLNVVWPSETMFVISRVLPVATAVVASCSLHLLFIVIPKSVYGQSDRGRRRFLVVGAFSAATVISGVPSDFLGAALLIGFFALIPSIVAEPGIFQYSILTFLSTATVAFSKGPYMYALSLMFFVAALTPSRNYTRIIPPAISALALYGFFRLNTFTSSIRPGFFSAESLGEHASAGGLPERILAVLFVVAPVALGLFSSILLNQQSGCSGGTRTLSLGLTTTVIFSVFSRLFVHADPRGHSYLFQPGVISSGLLAALFFEERVATQPRRRRLVIAAALLVALLWSYVVPALVPSLNSGSVVAKLLRMSRDASIVNLGLLLMLPGLLLLQFFRKDSKFVHKLVVVNLAAPILPIAMLVATSVPHALSRFEQRRVETASGEEDFWRQAVIGTADAREVSLVLRSQNTNDELAAYTMCGDDVKRGCNPPLIFAAYSESRFLSVISDLPEYWDFQNRAVREDYDFSVNLLAGSPEDGIDRLQLKGVSFLIVDRTRVGPNWTLERLQKRAKVIYGNQSFWLLKLISDQG